MQSVLTEKKEASASHMTAAKVLDTISQLPGMSGVANDAVSAYTQVKLSDSSILLKLPETECPTVFLETDVRNIGITWMTQSSHWNAICVAIHCLDCYGKEDWTWSLVKVGRMNPGSHATRRSSVFGMHTT